MNTGVYVFEPEIFTRIPPATFYDFGKQVFPELQRDGGRFFDLAMDGAYWCDIGTPEEYRRATRDVLAGRVRLLGDARVRGIPPSAVIGAGVEVDEHVRVGERARIGDRVRIVGASVLGDDVVSEDAIVARSIVWDGARIGAAAQIIDSIVGNDYVVAPGATLRDAIVAGEESPATI